MRAFLRLFRSVLYTGLVWGAVAFCAFGDPRRDGGVLGALAPALCTLLGIAFLVMVFAAPFLGQSWATPAQQRRALVLLFGIAGILCLYVGGRWVLGAWLPA